ncbi:MAG: hypothetical protein QW253_00120 [Metallosphaera sp.]
MSVTTTFVDRVLHVVIGPFIIPYPSANTDYYIPPTSMIDFRPYTKAMIVVEADAAIDVYLQTSYDSDVSHAKDLSGYSIPAGSFSITARNSIAIDGGNAAMGYIRLRLRTGTTPPSSIIVWIEAKTP